MAHDFIGQATNDILTKLDKSRPFAENITRLIALEIASGLAMAGRDREEIAEVVSKMADSLETTALQMDNSVAVVTLRGDEVRLSLSNDHNVSMAIVLDAEANGYSVFAVCFQKTREALIAGGHYDRIH